MSSIGEVNQYGNILFKRAKNYKDEEGQEIGKVSNYILQYGEPFYLQDLDYLIIGDGSNCIRDLINSHEYFAKVKDCGLFGDNVTLKYNNINNISLDTDVIANTKFVKKALDEYLSTLKQDVVIYELDQYYTGEYPTAPIGKTEGTRENIMRWQRFLNWYDAKYELTVDGDFGDKTEAATKDFQTQMGLEVDGHAGMLTIAASYYATKSHGEIPAYQQLIKKIHVNDKGKITIESEDLIVEGIPEGATALPIMDGVATVGTSPRWAREDHIHPTDTTKANIVAPTLEAKVIPQKITVTYGDVNGDGDIDATDVLVLRYYLEGVPEYQNINKFAADVNKDGVVNQLDLDALTEYITTGTVPAGTYIGTTEEVTINTYEYPKLNMSLPLTDSSSNFATTAFVNGTVSNIISGLTVPEQLITANQTLSKISETNGKIAVELQDINIPTSQVSGLTDIIPKPSETLPVEDGEAKTGTSDNYSREDHVHPHDSTKANVVAPVLKTASSNTNATTYPSLETGLDITDNSLNIANSSFVQLLNDSKVKLYFTNDISQPGFHTNQDFPCIVVYDDGITKNVYLYTDASTYFDLLGKITSDITTLTDAVNTKASQEDLNTLNTTVANQGNTLSQHTNQITDNTNNISTLADAVGDNTLNITANTDSINTINTNLGELTPRVDSLETSVANKVNKTDVISTINSSDSTINQARVDLTGYAKTTDLTDFAKKSDLDAYAKTTDLAAYAKKTDLDEYAKESELASYAKKTEIISIGTTAPTDTWKLWVDTTSGYVMKVYSGGSWHAINGAYL